ncbi:MAG: sodium:proline symporter, partial [Clostridia bacterium]|nr:sodium:proline symporter [Clostridia bacterium]
IVWVILSLGAAIAMALLGRGYLVTQSLVEAGQQELVFVALVQDIFNGPWAFVAGLLLAAIVAAAMSTADSQLLVASSSFTSDIYKPIFRKKASDKETLWVGRIVVLFIAVIAYFIASSKSEGAATIMTLVDNAWGGFGSAFGPVIILSLFWKRFTYKGAIAGVVGGALVDVLWMNFLADTGIYELLPGFIAGFICAVIVSLIDKKPSKEVEALYETAISAEIE